VTIINGSALALPVPDAPSTRPIRKT